MKQERTRPGVMVYFEDFVAADQTMTDEQMGRFIRAIVHYAKDGEWQTFDDDPILRFAFIGAKPKIDRDGETYEKKKLHGQYMTYVREAKENGEKYLKESEWIEQIKSTASNYQYLSESNSNYQSPIAVASTSASTFTIPSASTFTPGKGEAEGYKGDGAGKPTQRPLYTSDCQDEDEFSELPF